MQRQPTTTCLSVDAYLEGELESQVRHEYVDGEIYAMVGASDRHGCVPRARG
jgi:Uma2 family endonuclease